MVPPWLAGELLKSPVSQWIYPEKLDSRFLPTSGWLGDAGESDDEAFTRVNANLRFIDTTSTLTSEAPFAFLSAPLRLGL